MEEYEREQQINAQYVEEFAMLTSEKVGVILFEQSCSLLKRNSSIQVITRPESGL